MGGRPGGGDRPPKSEAKPEEKRPSERKPEYDVTKKGEKPGSAEKREKPAAAEKGEKNKLDEGAKNIIRDANDKSKGTDKERAERAVKQILEKYYGIKDYKVEYKKDEKGLGTDGPKKIIVGEKYLKGMDEKNFARRVIQAGHEVEHNKQYEKGMTGKNRQDEREFLANKWSAQAQEKPGTGQMSPGMRRDYANEALKRYDQMPKADREKYKNERDELVRYRDKLPAR